MIRLLFFVVIGVFALFLWRGVRASLNAPDLFGMLLGFGLVTMIVVQALFNISVVLAIVPTKGIPLPFISYGGSSLLLTLAASGVLLNISQHARVRGSSGRSSHDPWSKRANRQQQWQDAATIAGRGAPSWTVSRSSDSSSNNGEALRLNQSGYK